MNRHAALTLGLAIVLALSAASTVRAGTAKSPAVTTKVMVTGLEAIHYPVAHPTKLTCRGLGAAIKGRHTSFGCVATLKAHKQRRFYTRPVIGGWVCAGKKRSGCALLSHGFFPAPAADNQGWQSTAVLGWLQAHHVDKNGAASLSCTGLKSPMTCTLRTTPAVTVILSYQKVGAGYVETASLRPH